MVQGRAPGWVEREERKRVRVPATVLLPDGSSIEASVTDISFDGCRLETPALLPIGARLRLLLPKLGEVKAQVRWSMLGIAGLRFQVGESGAAQ